MNDFKQHIISVKSTVQEALKRLNDINDNTLTLFAVNDSDKIVGTLTDGDIRRGLLSGKTVSDKVELLMQKNYYWISSNNLDVHKIRKIRSKGIKLLPCLNDLGEIISVYNFNQIHSVLPIDAVIMAGGRGERLRPLTDSTPKPMLKLGSKPIIEHNIDSLINFGVENIYISVNYLGKQIEDYFGDGSQKGVTIKYIHEDKPLGTIGAIRNIPSYENDHILVMNSDLFTNINFETFFIEYFESDAKLAVASIPYSVNIPYAILERSGNKITGFKEKPMNTHYANAGIYLIREELIKRIPHNEFYNTTDLMNDVIVTGEKIIHSPILGYWIDIGKHDDYTKAQEIAKHLYNND